MKDIGLAGFPFSGKSTLFTALTRAGSHGGQANHAVVPVPDPRLAVLTEMERSRKTVHAQVGFVDVPGGTARARTRLSAPRPGSAMPTCPPRNAGSSARWRRSP